MTYGEGVRQVNQVFVTCVHALECIGVDGFDCHGQPDRQVGEKERNGHLSDAHCEWYVVNKIDCRKIRLVW